MIYKFDKILERDVDFIIMRAFAKLPTFSIYFLQNTKWANATVTHIEHSYKDQKLGESDITIIVEYENKKYALLVENKIDAIAMENQYERYHKRGKAGIDNGNYSDYAIFIVAPKKYIETNEEAKKYDIAITYEELVEYLDSPFDKSIIKKAIEKHQAGYTVNEVPEITDFWQKLYSFCCNNNKKIEMYPPKGPKGARAFWPQFKTSLKDTELYFKSDKGIVDLQFNAKKYANKNIKVIIDKFRNSDMHWEITGNSLSLRIIVEKIDFTRPFETFETQLNKMIDAVERLTKLSIELNDKGILE